MSKLDDMARAIWLARWPRLEPCGGRLRACIYAGCAAHPQVGYSAATTLGGIILAEWEAMIDYAMMEWSD